MNNKLCHLNEEEIKLRDIFLKVILKTKSNFSGLGLILYGDDEAIPVYPMRYNVPGIPTTKIFTFLNEISSVESDYHDGFVMVNSGWVLTKACQYFSPPIIDDIRLERTTGFGGRYLAALFGSKVAGVKLCGIISQKKEIILFKGGLEIYSEGVL